MPKTSFFVRANHDKNNTHSLYCRITYNGTKTEFSTGEKLMPKEWEQSTQKVISSKRKTAFIETLKETLSYNLKTIALMNNFTTAKELLQSLRDKKKPLPSLISTVENYIASVQSKVKPSTIRNHEIKFKNLKAYQDQTKNEFTTNSFDIVEAERFKTWYKNRANTENVSTASRNVLFFKSAMDCALQKGIISSHSLINYTGEKDKTKPAIFLTVEELQKIKNQNFQDLTLHRIKDLFLFQCYTGLSFGDIWSNWEIKEMEGSTILIGSRTKNNQAYFIPIDKDVIELLEKYNYKLPRYCNETYNEKIKLIGAICGVYKHLTTHVGRKTFATLRDADGWTRETVSKMLGHRSIRTTEIYYLGESTSRIENEMMKRIS